MNEKEIINRLRELKVPQERIGQAIRRHRATANKMLKGKRLLKAHELEPLEALLEEVLRETSAAASSPYLRVDVVPTLDKKASGYPDNDDAESVLLPRALLVDYLRGASDDFLSMTVRGDSMEPDFYNGDQVILDRRDVNPARPGAFALLVDGWGVLRNVQKQRDGVRVFSTNRKYAEESFEDGQLHIIGRPVWFARKLS